MNLALNHVLFLFTFLGCFILIADHSGIETPDLVLFETGDASSIG
jgi:hypothetical protein